MSRSKGATQNGAAPRRTGLPQPDAALLAKAADPQTGWRTLWLVAIRARHPAITRALAANSSAPPSLLGYLGRFSRWDVAVLVAQNPCCPGGLYNQLTMSANWAVVAAVASSPTAPVKLVSRLAGRYDARIAMAAAANPRLPAEYVAALLRSENAYVRGVAAANPGAPAEDLRQLAAGLSQPAWILRAIAANPSCPEDVSDQLLTWITLGGPGKADPLFDPVRCAGHPGDTDEPVTAWYSEQARQAAAHRHPLWRVRMMYPPMRPKIPLSTLGELRRDPRPEVRRAAARYLGVRPRAIRELMGDTDAAVGRIAASVQVQNRRRYVRRRTPVMARLTVPAVLIALGSLTSILNSSQSPPLSAISPEAPKVSLPEPYLLSGACTTRPATITRLAASGAVPALDASPAPVELPDGGWMTCGPTASGPEALVVSTGTTGLAVLVSETVRSASGRRYRDETIHIPAAHKVVLYLPDNPQVAAMTIIAADRPSYVITATLVFSSRAS